VEDFEKNKNTDIFKAVNNKNNKGGKMKNIMNKKVKIIVVLSIMLVILIGCIVVYSVNGDRNKKILKKEEISSMDDISRKIDIVDKKSSNITEEEAKSIANNFINKLNNEKMEVLRSKNILQNKEEHIERIKNELEDKEEILVSNKIGAVEIDAKTRKIIGYVNNNKNYKNSKNFNKENVIKISKDILKNINIDNIVDNFKEYTHISAEEFDEEIWRVTFIKDYNGFRKSWRSSSIIYLPCNRRIKYINNKR